MCIIPKLLLIARAGFLVSCGNKPEVDWELRALEAFIPEEATARSCSLHQARRTNATVEVVYGTFDPAAPYFAALRQSFPNSWARIYGGCVFSTVNGKSSQTQAVVRVCGRCRDAEEGWTRTHE